MEAPKEEYWLHDSADAILRLCRGQFVEDLCLVRGVVVGVNVGKKAHRWFRQGYGWGV